MYRIASLQERRQHRPHAFIIFAKYCLKHGEVILSHFKDHLVEDIKELSFRWVLFPVKHWSLQRLDHHVVTIKHFLGQYHQKLVDLLVVLEPQIFQLKELT